MMPTGIVSIEKLADGVCIVRRGGDNLTITSADIPNGATIDSAQAFINNFIASKGWFAICRIISLNPLDVEIGLSDKPITGVGI